MVSSQEKMQTSTYSETKFFQIRHWVFLLAVPPEIILPKDWSIVLATTLDSTDPIILALLMHCFNMTL